MIQPFTKGTERQLSDVCEGQHARKSWDNLIYSMIVRDTDHHFTFIISHPRRCVCIYAYGYELRLSHVLGSKQSSQMPS